jgi:hypothetical protein
LFEEAERDEFGEAQRKQCDFSVERHELDQDIGNHGADDLQVDGIFAAAQEGSELEMLFEPAEQEFDLPALFIEAGNCGGGR